MDEIKWISEDLIKDLLLEAKKNPINPEWYIEATNMYSYKINGEIKKIVAKDYSDAVWKLKNIKWFNKYTLTNLWKVEKNKILNPKGRWFIIAYK